jgi:hypothetical protein
MNSLPRPSANGAGIFEDDAPGMPKSLRAGRLYGEAELFLRRIDRVLGETRRHDDNFA